MSAKIADLFRLDDKVALITGGARDFGYDIGEALAELGCDLVITSRSQASVEKAAERLRHDFGRHVLPLDLDVRDYDQVAAVVQQAHAFKGRLDILVNNAGGSTGTGPNHLFERSREDIDSLIATNLLGSMYCCQHVGRLMAKAGRGKIINIASIAASIGRDRRMYERSDMKGQPVDYAAAKAGMLGMTFDLAGLLSPLGIQVNAISPGGFGPRELADTFVADYSNATPLGRMGRDGIDLKGAAVYLACPASDYVTGINLVVDGGFSIWK
jgi:NAD(P)-dependent dehydrogenase (short-subunit alcohol dehydrogenase family)